MYGYAIGELDGDGGALVLQECSMRSLPAHVSLMALMVSDVELGKKLETMSVPPDLHQLALGQFKNGQLIMISVQVLRISLTVSQSCMANTS